MEAAGGGGRSTGKGWKAQGWGRHGRGPGTQELEGLEGRGDAVLATVLHGGQQQLREAGVCAYHVHDLLVAGHAHGFKHRHDVYVVAAPHPPPQSHLSAPIPKPRARQNPMLAKRSGVNGRPNHCYVIKRTRWRNQRDLSLRMPGGWRSPVAPVGKG